MSHIFSGGTILTMDPNRPQADIVITEGDRIAAVGPAALQHAYPSAIPVDLGGRTLIPGFVDAHNHLSLSALHPRWADVGKAAGLDEVARRLLDHSHLEREAAWIRGCNWEAAGHVRLTRHDLDAMGFGRPVIVAHYSLHQCVVSSHGLDILEIGPGTPDPYGGVIEREDGGRPTGVLRERAWSGAHAASLEAYADHERWPDLIAARANQLIARGVTAVHDAACSPAAEDAYRSLRSEGRLPLSVVAMPHAAPLLAGVDRGRLEGPPTGEGDETLRVGPVKVFADGGASPWIEATLYGRQRSLGIPFPPVADEALLAAGRGFDVAIHAMGNAGLAAALDACDAVRRHHPETRLRIEHVTLASPADIRRMAELDVTAVVQPGFVETIGRNVHSLRFDDVIWMPFGSLHAADLALAASSDEPSGTCDPLGSSRLGVSRTTAAGRTVSPTESLPFEQWLQAWTVGAAGAGGQGSERGSLTPGQRADLVMVDGLLGDDPRVAETWIGGRRRFSREPFPGHHNG